MRILVLFLSLFIATPVFAQTAPDIVKAKRILEANLVLKEMLNCQAHIQYMVNLNNIYSAFQSLYKLPMNDKMDAKLKVDFKAIEDNIKPRIREVVFESGIPPENLQALEQNLIDMVAIHLQNRMPFGQENTTKYLQSIFRFITTCSAQADVMVDMFIPKKKADPITEPALPKIKVE